MRKSLSVFITFLLLASFVLRAEETSLLTSDESYQNANKDFDLILKAAQDVGEKECKSEAPNGELARSAYLWFSKGKLLSDSERVRFNIHQSEVAKIQKRMNALLESKDSARIQSEGFLLQAELLSTDINFLWGTHGRIEARTHFWIEIKNGPAAAQYEDKLWLDSYDKDLVGGLSKAMDIAKNACEQEEKVEGCEDAQAQIQKAMDMAGLYKDKYSQKNLPSKKIHEDLLSEEEKLANAINAIVTGNQDYDWKTPATNALEKIITIRKKVNVFCPESKGSKSQEKAVKIAEIFEDKSKSDEDKKIEMIKVDPSLANSLIGGGLSVDDLKKIPTEWNRQNLMIGLGSLREPLVSEISKKIEALIAQDRKKYEVIKEKRAKVYKLILAMGDMSKNKLDLNAECGSDPHPGIYVCPGRTPNPLCDPNSSEHFNKVNYNACKYRVEQQNDMISKLANADEALRKNPNVVGVEAHYIGTVGPLWRAIIKNPDGSTSYENLIKSPSQNGADYSGNTFGGVQNDPKNNNTPANNSTPSSSGSGSGSSGPGSSGSSNNTTNPGTSSKTKEAYFKEYSAQLSKITDNKDIEIKNFCGKSPCAYGQIDATTGEIKTCTYNPNMSSQDLIKYNGCVQAVKSYNKSKNKTTSASAIIELSAESQKIYDEFVNKVVRVSPNKAMNVPTLCGANPCGATNSTKTCTVSEEEKAKVLEYNLCANAVREHNARLDAGINLSNYIKTHSEFVGVERSPETNLWMAKMKNSDGGFYYLPLNYKP